MKIILFSLVFFCCLNFGHAQSGELDPSFGNKGIVTTNMGSNFNYRSMGRQVLLLPDGSMYLVYEAVDLTVITKKKADGSPDLTFGINGLSVAVPLYSSHAALQKNGKIVVAGNTHNFGQGFYNTVGIGVAVFNADGRLDNSFGKDGITTTDLGHDELVYSVAIQDDGKIIVAGTSLDLDGGPSFILLVRYNTDGGLDKIQNTSLSVSYQYANAVAIQNDGKIILGGSALLRYDSTLDLDTGFNGNGHQTIDGNVNCIAIQSDGKIIVAGNSLNDIGDPKDFTLARYNTNGSLDISFGVDGKQATDFGGLTNETAISIAIQTNGKIILGGYTMDGTNINFAIARYDANGIPDSSFSVDGKLITDFGNTSNDYINNIVIQNDGKLIVLGYTGNGINTYVAAARYDVNGNADNSFDNDGVLTDHISQGSTIYTCTAIQANGKILSAGYSWNGSNYDFALVRYNTDGLLDSSFSGDGKLLTDFNSSDDRVGAIAIQTDGRILVAGSASDNFGLARYNTDGSLDLTFDHDGMQTSDFGSTDFANSIAIQRDGKILAGGTALARYNPNGSLDSSFDADGKLATAFDSNYPFNSNDMALQSDGKIVIVGLNYNTTFIVVRYNINGAKDSTFGNNGEQYFEDLTGSQLTGKIVIQNDGKIMIGGGNLYAYRDLILNSFELMRLNIDGTPDNTFNGGEILYTYVNNSSRATSLAVQSDNKIIIAGYSYNESSDDFTILRYNINGSLDSGFNNDGVVLTQPSAAYDKITSVAIAGNKLYAAGYGQYPGNYGVVARYLLGPGEIPGASTFISR
ncbi:MAG: hypothetical protein ABI760_18495, partial [Ferruginibacter sp.]